MNRTRVLLQLLIFGFISVLVIYYTAFDVLGVKLTHRPFQVTVHLKTGGGIFAGAEVAYRGVAVGRVTSVTLKKDEVTLSLDIDQGTKIAANSVAHIYDLSVVGEQYVDFVPPAFPSQSRLHAGSDIPVSQTTVPLPVADGLLDIEQWIASINPADISTVTREGGAAFAGTGDELRQILNDTGALISQLSQNPGDTSAVLRNSATLLKGMTEHSSDFDTFTRAMSSLSLTLANSSPTVTQFLDESAPTTQLFESILSKNASGLSILWAGMATFGHVLAADVPALKALLVALPDFAQLAPRIVVGDHINGLALMNTGFPVCNTGIPLSNPLAGTKTPLKKVSCAPQDGLLARGAANAPPIPGTPFTVAPLGPTAEPSSDRSVQVGSYDPTSSTVTAADGSQIHFGTDGGQSNVMGRNAWQAILSPALGY